jgi:hypothetical protein
MNSGCGLGYSAGRTHESCEPRSLATRRRRLVEVALKERIETYFHGERESRRKEAAETAPRCAR